MKKLIIPIFFYLLSTPIVAQVSVGFYPIQSELSLSTNSERLIWGDLKLLLQHFYRKHDYGASSNSQHKEKRNGKFL